MEEPLLDVPLSPGETNELRQTVGASSWAWAHRLLATVDYLRAALATARQEEREECAKVAEAHGVNSPDDSYEAACDNVADLIRSRS